MREDGGISLFDVCKNEREKRILADPDLHETLRILFIRLGVTPRFHGYDYLLFAVKIGIVDRKYLRHVTTCAYTLIAARFDVDPAVVERDIRRALETIVVKNRISVLNDYLGAEVFGPHDRPTNAEFISLVADKITCDLIRRGKMLPVGM